MARPRPLTPANWVKRRIHWEMRSPTFKVPFGEDPTLLPAIAAQQAVAKRVLDHVRDSGKGTYGLAKIPLGSDEDGIDPVLSPLPYLGLSSTVANALAGGRLLTFDVFCELVAVFGPDVVPGASQLLEVMKTGLEGVEKWPAEGTWQPRRTRPVMDLASARAMASRYLAAPGPAPEPEEPHPDADVAINGLLIELADAIDAWGGAGTAESLEVDVDVFIGNARANLVVTDGLITGQMWLPADWGVRIAEEVRGPVGAFVIDELGTDDVAGYEVPLYRVVAPLRDFEPTAWAENPIYLALGDGVGRVWQDAEGGGIEWFPVGRE